MTAYKKQKTFHNINDLEGKSNFLDRNYRSVVRQQETLIISSIIKFPYPEINLFLVIESDFAIYMSCRDVEMNTIGNYNIPKCVTDQSILEILIENMKKSIQNNSKSNLKMIFILKLVMSFLLLVQEESNI